MKNDKPAPKPNNEKSEEVFLTLRGPVREWLERERGGERGRRAGVKLQPIILNKLARQMEAEREGRR